MPRGVAPGQLDCGGGIWRVVTSFAKSRLFGPCIHVNVEEPRAVLLLPQAVTRVRPHTTPHLRKCASRADPLDLGNQVQPPAPKTSWASVTASSSFPASSSTSSSTPPAASANWLHRRCEQRQDPHLHSLQLSFHSARAEASCWHAAGALALGRHRRPSRECPPAPHGLRLLATLPTGFRALGVSHELEERLAALRLQTPLPVQAAAVPLILSGRNTAIKSCTGSGKTLAYLLPVIQLALERRRAAVIAARAASATGAGGSRPDADLPSSSSSSSESPPGGHQALAALKRQSRSPQAVILAPSRELCIQIQRFAQDLMPGPPANRRLVAQLVGGANPKRQAAALAGGAGGLRPLVVVGTPGRVADMVTQGSLQVWGCPLLVLDEVDQLYGQAELRQHVDAICAHVGRRWQPDPVGPDQPLRDDGSQATQAGEAAPPQSFSGGAGGCDTPGSSAGSDGSDGSSGRHGGRQTVIVSASLDARERGRYATWCPDPSFVVLSSLQALPPPVLQTLPPAAKEVGAAPTSANAATGHQVQAVPTLAAGPSTSEALHRRMDDSDSASQAPLDSRDTQQAGVGGSGPSSGGPEAASGAASPSASAAAGPLSGVLPPHLAHLYVLTHSKHRTDRVRRLIHALQAERVLLFVPKQNQTMVTKYRLEARRMEVSILHGRLTKLERGNIMNAFRRGVFRALVVTDLGARGLDLPECDAVINFGPPADALAYAHRAGRTGRAGAPGVVASVVTRLELPGLRRIARQLGVDLQAASVSHGTIAPGEETTGANPSDSE